MTDRQEPLTPTEAEALANDMLDGQDAGLSEVLLAEYLIDHGWSRAARMEAAPDHATGWPGSCPTCAAAFGGAARQEAADTSGLRADLATTLLDAVKERVEHDLGYHLRDPINGNCIGGPEHNDALREAYNAVVKEAALSQEPTPDERPLDVEP